MRGNQQTTQEIPQSSFAMTILPGAGPARTRKVRGHKTAQPPAEIAQPVEIAPEIAQPVEIAQPAEIDAPTAADNLTPPPPPPAQLTPPPAQFSPAPAQFSPAPAQFSPPPPPAPYAPPPAQFSPPPPPPADHTPPPPPAPFAAPPPPADYTPPLPPAQFAPPPPPPLQFAPLSTADRFGLLSPPPASAEPGVAGWYAPLDASEPAAAPSPDYPTTFPTSPGYPPQPLYAEHPDATAFPAAPEVAWSPQHAAPGAYDTSAGRSTASKVLIGLAIAVLGFVVLGILAAIAIPVFLSQHQKPANRNVVLPATLVDQQRLNDPALAADTGFAITNMQQHIPGGSQTQAAYYGLDGTPTFMVVAGKLARRPTAADVTAFFSTKGTAADPTLTKMGSGQFGGTLECGISTVQGKSLTTCASLDSAAAIIVIAANTEPSQLAIITRQVIGSVEQQG